VGLRRGVRYDSEAPFQEKLYIFFFYVPARCTRKTVILGCTSLPTSELFVFPKLEGSVDGTVTNDLYDPSPDFII
jgi:hypothetical protein